MNRFPWRSRVWLIGLVDAVAGGVIAVLVYLGLDQGVELVHVVVGLVDLLTAALATLGILKNGEAETTPIDDPLGADRLPLMPFREDEALRRALADGDLEGAKAIVGPPAEH